MRILLLNQFYRADVAAGEGRRDLLLMIDD